MSAIKTVVLPRLRERFPGGRYDDTDPKVIVTFAGPPEIGELKVWDDGDEVRVGIGEFTHVHITAFESKPYDADISKEEIVKRVAKEVLTFLDDFFAERIVVWTEPRGVVTVGPVEAMPAPDGTQKSFSWKGRLNSKPG